MTKKNKEICLVSEERKTHDLQLAARMIMPLARALLGKNGFAEIDLISEWKNIVGEDIASYSLPKQIIKEKARGAKLVVEVPSGACALELQLRENILVSKINAYFGKELIRCLKIVQNIYIELPGDENVGNNQKNLVTEEEENYITELVDGLTNKELQKKLANLGRFVIGTNKDD